jgi:hypothetical protein
MDRHPLLQNEARIIAKCPTEDVLYAAWRSFAVIVADHANAKQVRQHIFQLMTFNKSSHISLILFGQALAYVT